MAGRDVLRGRRWRRVGAGTGPAHGVSGGTRRLGGPQHGVRDARRWCGMRAGQRRARPARQRWLDSAARSAKTVAMRGPKECSRWPVRPPGRVSVRAREPVVTRGAVAR
jgi:hypothetical protein